MCGLGGVIFISTKRGANSGDRLVDERTLDAIDWGIRHRGPDGQGRFRAEQNLESGVNVSVALVHRRLAIIDPACGQQPMALRDVGLPKDRNRDELSPATLFHGKPTDSTGYSPVRGAGEPMAVAFNGCIYNHRTLRNDLTKAGHRFVSDHSDTEVLLHGTREHGPDLPRLLDGMFAYAVWDPRNSTLTLARDMAGEKPLYYAVGPASGEDRAGHGLVFCSTVPGLLAAMATLGWPVRTQQVAGLLWLKHGYWPKLPLNIEELPPGHRLVFGPDGLAVTPVCPPPARAHPVSSPLDLGTIERLIADTVASRLDADVPIGCFLSGGVDSSVVSAFAQRAMQRDGRVLRTFTVKMPDARMDESEYAQAVAQRLGTHHDTLPCRTSAAADLVALIGQLGLPFGDSSILPTHWVSCAARELVTVALGGDGGDELFGGYQRYFVNRWMTRLGPVLRLASRIPVPGLGGNLRRVMQAARYHGYDDLATILRTPQVAALWKGDARSMLDAEYATRHVGDDARHDDFAQYLPLDLARKVDTASMAIGLEVRAPLLGRDLATMLLSVDLETATGGQGRKGLLRAIARNLVPAHTVDRKKQGFGVPIGRWIRDDFGGLRTLTQDVFAARDPFGTGDLAIDVDVSAARAMAAEHLSGKVDHGQRLFVLLSMGIWCQWLKRTVDAATTIVR